LSPLSSFWSSRTWKRTLPARFQNWKSMCKVLHACVCYWRITQAEDFLDWKVDSFASHSHLVVVRWRTETLVCIGWHIGQWVIYFLCEDSLFLLVHFVILNPVWELIPQLQLYFCTRSVLGIIMIQMNCVRRNIFQQSIRILRRDCYYCSLEKMVLVHFCCSLILSFFCIILLSMLFLHIFWQSVWLIKGDNLAVYVLAGEIQSN
jgi:hypothetical protein